MTASTRPAAKPRELWTLYEVWHKTTPTFFVRPGETLVFPAGYTHVADVEAPALGAVYDWTNHVDAPWWDHEDVTLVGAKDKRSTSVGDVVVEALAYGADAHGAPLFRRWVVASVGFTAF